MPRAEGDYTCNVPLAFMHAKYVIIVGTPKYLANAMKSKGLQRLRWYCQVCEKQCRDENGFKCHAQSESHLRQMLVVGENAGRHISDFSGQFQAEFVALLSRRYTLIPAPVSMRIAISNAIYFMEIRYEASACK